MAFWPSSWLTWWSEAKQLKTDEALKVGPFLIGSFVNIILLIVISLTEPEPLLAILRPDRDKIAESNFGFTLLSLDRNRLTAATFFACFTFVITLRIPFVAFRVLFLLFSSSFKNETYKFNWRRSLFCFYFFRGIALWIEDLRNLPLQLIPPGPIRQGFFESSSFIANSVGDRREFFIFSSVFGIFLSRRSRVARGATTSRGNALTKTSKSRWIWRGWVVFSLIYFFGGEGYIADTLRGRRGVFGSDCWFRGIRSRAKLSSWKNYQVFLLKTWFTKASALDLMFKVLLPIFFRELGRGIVDVSLILAQ